MKQADLFEISTDGQIHPKSKRIDFLSQHKWTLRLDQALLFSIVLLAAFAFTFSMGVENGKKFAFKELKAQKEQHEKSVKELSQQLFASKSREHKDLSVQLTPIEPKESVTELARPLEPEVSKEVQTLGEVYKSAPQTPAQRQYTIQMVTYKTEKAAHELIKKMRESGHKTFLIPSGKYLQICLESFESRQSASRFLSKMKGEGIIPKDAFVRPLPQ